MDFFVYFLSLLLDGKLRGQTFVYFGHCYIPHSCYDFILINKYTHSIF